VCGKPTSGKKGGSQKTRGMGNFTREEGYLLRRKNSTSLKRGGNEGGDQKIHLPGKRGGGWGGVGVCCKRGTRRGGGG